MQPRDITRLTNISDPRLHPDGRRVAFGVKRASMPESDGGEHETGDGSNEQEKKGEKDRYTSEIWLWDGDEARPFTHGPTDASPRWSPDGRHLAFIRKAEGDDEKPQVALMPADGGEARILTDFPLGAEAIEWSPDGSRLAVVGVTWIDEVADLDDEERKRRPRRILHPQWNLDNEGWTHDKRRHIYVVDPFVTDDVEPTLITPGDFDDGGPRWHPDGDRIAFLSARHDERHLDPGNQIWVVPADGGDAEPLTEIGSWGGVSWRPDGVAHAIGLDDRWGWPDNQRVYRIEDGGGLTDLTGHLDRSITPGTPTCSPNEPHWIGDDRFLTLLEDRGRVRAITVDADGTASDVLGGDRCITGLAPREDGTAFAFTATDPTDPGELHWYEDGDERVLTTLNEEFRREVGLVEPTYFTYDESGIEVDAWIFAPPGEEKVPLLFNIHGGPASQYGWYFFDEFQVYVGAGYGVVATNPRGSDGRGRDWLRAVVGVRHEEIPPDVDDLRAAVDAAVGREPRFDVERVGVMGGSYGGYVTSRIIAVDHRFKSAIVERGLLAWPSFAGTSDIGTYFDRMYLDAQLPDDYELLWRASPIAYAHQTETPTLVLHSENDLRCPIEQAEQYFVMLQRHGVVSEFVRFPGEGHELSRSGKPRHRVERFEIVLDWHQRHLSP
jgi:dipeptidyl aminopeptidase/acylaminoacyl peptidase